MHNAQWIVFIFWIPFNVTLHDFKRFQLVSISFSCMTSAYTFLLRTMQLSYCSAICFKTFSRWQNPQLQKTFIQGMFWLCFISQRQSWALCLKLPEHGNIYLLEMTLDSLLCSFCLCFAALSITVLEQVLKANWQNIHHDRHWKLETFSKVGLQSKGAHYLI